MTKPLLCGIAGLICAAASGVAVDPSSNPYQGIVDRNVFGLKPPTPTTPPEPPRPPLPAVTLQGITTVLGSARAFMKMNVPPKPGEKPAGEQSFMLAAGQRDGDIEVLEIDEKTGNVKIKEFGTVTNLTFEANGVKVASLPPPPPPAQIPGAVNPAIPQPAAAANPAFTHPGSGDGTIGGLKTIPTRSLRVPNATTTSGVTPQAAPSLNFGYGGTPQAQGSGATTISGEQIPTDRTPEQNVLLYEANRLKNEQLIQSGARLPRLPSLLPPQRPAPGQQSSQ